MKWKPKNKNWTLKVHRIEYSKEVIIMKFIDFIKKYYIVSQRSFSYSYSYEEQKILEKNIFQRKRYETVSLLASQRKKAIINSYIFLGISLVLLLILIFIDIRFLWALIPFSIIAFIRLLYVDFSIINVFKYYLLYQNSNNVFKELLKDHFENNNLISKINNIEYCLCYSFRKHSLCKLNYEIINNNSYFIKMTITRHRIVLKSKIQKKVIKDKNLIQEEVISQINLFMDEHRVNNSNKQYEWVFLKTVSFNEKFEVYGIVISLNLCICENKDVGINSKNPYKISKAVKYRFSIDCIKNTILVKKLKENEYAIFTKKEK